MNYEDDYLRGERLNLDEWRSFPFMKAAAAWSAAAPGSAGEQRFMNCWT